MHRFFLYSPAEPEIGPPAEGGGPAVARSGTLLPLPAPAARQIERVLRLRAGDRVILIAPGGTNLEAELVQRDGKWHGRILRSFLPPTEPEASIELWQGLLKGERWDFVLQKGTELGVTRFRPLLTERTVARPEAGRVKPRWIEIMKEAAEQSGRNLLPDLLGPQALSGACAGLPPPAPGERRYLVWEEERETGLAAALQALPPGTGRVLLLLGPEGGLSAGEAALAKAAGFQPVHLGRRILRAETAALAAVSLCLAALGELGAGGGPRSGAC